MEKPLKVGPSFGGMGSLLTLVKILTFPLMPMFVTEGIVCMYIRDLLMVMHSGGVLILMKMLKPQMNPEIRDMHVREFSLTEKAQSFCKQKISLFLRPQNMVLQQLHWD